jgi:hypothetical protein
MNRERGDREIDDNGFPVRPALLGNLRARNYDVVYLGYGVDGRIGRINLSAQAYGAFGQDRDNIFTSKHADIRSYFFAVEPSYDIDWIGFAARSSSRAATASRSTTFRAVSTRSSRTRSSPAPTRATGSARRSRSPAAAARCRSTAATAFSIRFAPPRRGSVQLRQSGTVLVGVGADFDISPQWRSPPI